MTPATAEKPRPTFTAGWFVHYVHMTELLNKLRFNHARFKCSEFIFFPANKFDDTDKCRLPVLLGKILMSGATAREPLSNTWAIIKCYIEVEEIKRIAFTPLLQINSCQFFIFFHDYRQIIIGQHIWFINTDNRFDRNLLANFCHIEY